MSNKKTLWEVAFTSKAHKQAMALPPAMNDALFLLQKSLEADGPVQSMWYHYGKLKGKKGEYYHCHLNKGKPRYVVVWRVEKERVHIVEICFVGTHESVNYARFK